MDNLDIYKRMLQHKREAYHTMLGVVQDLEYCTSTVDVQCVFDKYSAKTTSGNWVTFMKDGVLVELNVQTMCVICNKGGGVNATARHLLDMSLQKHISEWCELYLMNHTA